jgi:hypothetical protein
MPKTCHSARRQSGQPKRRPAVGRFLL